MILVKSCLNTYKRVCKLISKYGHKLKTADDVEKFLSYLTNNGVQVDRADYDGNDIDLEVGTTGISLTYDLVPSHIVLLMNVPDTNNKWEHEKDIGGWVEYDTKKDIIKFPFLSFKE